MITNGILLKNLTLSYLRHPAVHHLSGLFSAGTMTAVMGPNGGGKSTLVRALAGLHPIDEGEIVRSNDHQLEVTAFLPQTLSGDRQFPLSVYELVEMGLVKEIPFWRSTSPNQKERIFQALNEVDLYDHRNEPVGNLSLGQFQRALFARVIVQKAQVVILDEPFTGLDERSTDSLLKIMHQWHDQNKTLIVVLHDRNQALRHFESTILLSKELKAWGRSEEVLAPSSWESALGPVPASLSEEECLH